MKTHLSDLSRVLVEAGARDRTQAVIAAYESRFGTRSTTDPSRRLSRANNRPKEHVYPREVRMQASSTTTGAVPAPPSRPALVEYALRQVAAALVVAAAAVLVHRAGLHQHVWPYAVMAGAIAPQVLMAVVALGDEERRARLRSLARPAPLPALLALGLALTAVGGWLAGQAVIGIGAAVVASIGLGVSALPTHLHVPRR